MTSTNDGKDVKSNQTSGQKGKTYYIELYKSLEARLSAECTGEQRTRLVCEAWRRVHSLCQHSAPTTHPHLLAWLQRHTSHTILQTEWQSPKSKDQHVWLEEAIDTFIAECHTAISARDGVTPSWESQLLHRAQWFRKVLSNPWGHPVLKALLDSRGVQPTDEEVLGWLKEERGVMFVTRLRQLAASKCDDLALLLATAVMLRARNSTAVVSDVDQAADHKDQAETARSEPTFVDILRKDAGFTVDVWELLTDIEFVLLHKGESRSRCIELAKQTPLRNGYQLVERLHSRLEMSPRDKKMWKNAKEVATLIAQVVIARCMVVPTCSGAARVALYGCARSLVRLLPADKLPTAAAALAAPAATSRHLHTLASAIHAQCKDERKSFVCELYVRAITAGMNELERLKLKTEKEAEARLTEETLSTWFTQLGSLLSASSRLSSECVLTAFSVHPSSFMYDRVKAAPLLAPILKDIHEPRSDTNSEFGSWATDSRTQTNLVKTSETINLKQTQKQANVLSTAIFAEGEALGLGAELCQDLAVLISGPRVKTLSWDMDRETLLENCRTYMERTHGGTRALTTELKYLNLDPRSFQHLPEEIDDENDAFYGIEKGYEHLVELQEPEEIWQDALSDNPTLSDSAHSIEELPIVIPRRKKKSRRLKYSTDDEIDPLSLVGDTNTTVKERPSSKERSKEKKERLDKIKIKKESSKDFDPSTEIVQKVGEKPKEIRKKEKKKERKERKKKEKVGILEFDTKQQKPPSGSLSRLVGMKVARIPEVNGQLKMEKSDLDSNINNNLCITDSDYDSQGKSSITSINSEGNDPDVLFDGLFSMDEIKSPEKSTDCIQRSNTFKTEELRVSNGIIINNTLAVPKIRHATNQQQRINFSSIKSDSTSSGQSSNNDVREEVKKSIKKLIEFRRHKSINDGSMKLEEPYPHQTLTPDLPTSDKLTSSNSPKVYFNRDEIEQFNALKDEVNIILKNCSNRGNIVQESTFLNDLNKKNDKINSNLCDKTHDIVINRASAQACSTSVKSYHQPVIKANSNHSDLQLEKTVKNDVLKSNETPSQIQYKEFLKQRSCGVIKTHPLVKNVTDISSQKALTNLVKKQSSKQICKPRQKQSNTNVSSIESIQRDFPKQPKTDVSETLNSNKDDGNIPLQSSISCQSMTSANLTTQNQFQSFLKELQETINAGASKEKPDVKFLSDKTNCPKQKKVDNAPNTFSRLSYLHKNKHNDNKHKILYDQTKTLKNKTSEEKQNLNMNLDKVSHLQTRGDIVVSRVDKTKSNSSENTKLVVQNVQNFKCSPLTKTTPLCLNRQYPIISNMLMSENRSYDSNISNEAENKNLEQKNIVTPAASLKGHLTENDQNDLILLLRQQSKMHPLKLHHKSDDVQNNPSNCTVTINMNKQSSVKSINKDIQPKDPQNVNRNVPILDKPISTSNSSSSVKVSNNKSSNAVSELKKVRTVKCSGKGATSKQTVKSNDNQTSDWESVMNALLAQKTPSRGPNALDIVLKKDSFEKRSLQNAECHTIKAACSSSNSSRKVGEYANSKQCPMKTKSTLASSGKTVQLDMTPSPYLKQKHDKKLGGQDNNIVLGRNSPLDYKEKHLPDVIQNANDPFISGIPNSDYDLLEELMDDDLRKEIGELMSDEEPYSALTQGPKTKTVPNTKTSHAFVNKYPNQSVDSTAIRKSQRVDSCQNLDLVHNKNVFFSSKPMKDLQSKCNNQINPVSQTKLNISTAITDSLNKKPRIISNELITPTMVKQTPNSNICGNIHPVKTIFTSEKNNLKISNVCNKNIGNNIPATSTCNKSKVEEVAIKDIHKNNTDKANIQNQALDPTRVILTVPQRSATPNMMMIGSDLIYNPYSTGQIEQSNKSSTNFNRNAYVAVNKAPNFTLFTTQFVAPCVNPVIIDRSITLPVIRRVSPNMLMNLKSNISLNLNSSENNTTIKPDKENNLKTEEPKSNCKNKIENNIKVAKICHKTREDNKSPIIVQDPQGRLVCNISTSKTELANNKFIADTLTNSHDEKLDIKELTQPLQQSTSLDINHGDIESIKPYKLSKRVEMKIESKSQDNKSLLSLEIGPEIKNPIKKQTDENNKCEKEEATYRERIQLKRMVILNRQLYHRCQDKPIALSYKSITPTKEVIQLNENLHNTHIKNDDNTNFKEEQNIALPKQNINRDEYENSCQKVSINDNNEGKNTLVSPSRRILLRSSNVLKDTTILSPTEVRIGDKKQRRKLKCPTLIKKRNTFIKPIINKNKTDKSSKSTKLTLFEKQIKSKENVQKNNMATFETNMNTNECVIENQNESSTDKSIYTYVDIEEKITSAIIPNILSKCIIHNKHTEDLKQTENRTENIQNHSLIQNTIEKFPSSFGRNDTLDRPNKEDNVPNLKEHVQNNTELTNPLENEEVRNCDASNLNINDGVCNINDLKTKPCSGDSGQNSEILSSVVDENINNVKTNNKQRDICSNANLDVQKPMSSENCTGTQSETSIKELSTTIHENILEYKDKVIFEEIPSYNNDPLKKCVRIKLPNGNTFKATISGRLSVNVDSIFEDPKIKALLWQNINNNTKCTLNIKQVAIKTPHTSHTIKTKVHDISYMKKPIVNTETINLISDDEDITQTFKTEFGKFDVAFMNKEMFNKHQSRLSQKCVVEIERLPSVINAINESTSELKSKVLEGTDRSTQKATTTYTKCSSNDNTLQKNVTLVYKGDSSVVLKGSIYEDPVVGTCYVFPILNRASYSDEMGYSNICDEKTINVIKALKNKVFEDHSESDENENSNNFNVVIPKVTYSRQKIKEVEAAEKLSKKYLKRKSDTCDIKLNEKRYRKSKNIDYPKITVTAMTESAYSKEYKRLFNYCSSIKFSFSQPFHKEYIDVSSVLKCWPIKGAAINTFDKTDNDNILFSDEKTDGKEPYDPLQQTLAEEISSKFVEHQSSCDQIREKNFSMGFGEGSGRVKKILEDGDNNSKFSAATLSDVKQSQPFLLSEDYEDYSKCEDACKPNKEQFETVKRYVSYLQMRDKVRAFFKKTTFELNYDWHYDKFKNRKNIYSNKVFPYDLISPDFIEPAPIETVVQVVQVGQLPVSGAAQNPVTCDPRVTQVTDASPSQCLVENSPHDDSQPTIKTEYTELTTADLSLPLAQEYERHIKSQESSKVPICNENIPVQMEISEVKVEEMPIKDEPIDYNEDDDDDLNLLVNKPINNVDFSYNSNESTSPLEPRSNMIYESIQKQNSEFITHQKQQNGSAEKSDQIAHAMNAAGITTTPEFTTNLVNIPNPISPKLEATSPVPESPNYSNSSINAMALQQAFAQILPPPLNQTNSQDNIQVAPNSAATSQVLHIVQNKNTNGNQITLVDNAQNTVINNSNTSVLHIVQNKGVNNNSTSNANNGQHSTSYGGLSLVDSGIQQGNNQLLHIVNTGNQKNPGTGQLLKRVNLLTNLTNMQGSNEQKMVQFLCKAADGKSIHLNNPHQRSMVLRLQPIDSSNIQVNNKTEDSSQSSNKNISTSNKETVSAQHEIKSRSVYEENYAKFIQNSSNKSVPEKSTSLPKFNQAFGKQVYQDSNHKSNDINSNTSHLSSVDINVESSECQSSDNTLNLDHIGQINSPPLLLRKSSSQTTSTQPNLMQQIKQTISPMNIQTMHGGVIYTRQIPVNIGGGQTINLITVPSTELADETNQKQHNDVKFINQNEMESPIIKLVPQASSSDVTSDESINNISSNENSQNTPVQHQPVLTQMRIKLPMLSKAPQMMSGTRLVRPSFFQIQRNVIGGANQPVYQQLVLTAAPPLGQHTIRLPQAQTTRHVKVTSESQSSSESQMSTSTLEQLREFDMVLEQVKERSTVQPNNQSNYTKLHTPSSDTAESTSITSTVTESTQQVLYSIGSNQSVNVAYVSRKPNVTTPTQSAFERSPDSSGIIDSPSSSTSHVQIPHTVTSESTSSDGSSTQPIQQKAAKVGSKSKSRPKSSHPPNSLKINTVPPKTSTQKPLEDEQTTQRILYILAEYKEQVENSPDKDKPAPRRRNNPPSNPSGSSKRKKSSSSSRRPGARDISPVNGDDTCRTMGSEDSSCGTSQGDCTESCLESHSPQDSPRKVVRKLSFENETPRARPQPQRNVIVADGQTITVARGTAGKPTTAVLMPANYILPVSMVKGGQQIAIVTNRGPKLLTVGGGEGGTTNALLLQRLIGPAGLKPVLTRPGVRHVRLPTAALHNLQAFNLATATTVPPPDSTASPAPEATPPELIETRTNSSPWADRESQEIKPERESSPEGSEPWNLSSSGDPHDYSYEETVRTDNMGRTVLVVQRKDGGTHRQHRLTHVSAAALRHKYAILEHELRLQGTAFLQKSLSEECEDLGVDSPSAAELFPEAELFSGSPAHEAQQHSHTPQPTILNQSGISQPDLEDQIASDRLLRQDGTNDQHDLGVTLGLDEGIVTVSEDGMQATITLDQEEFARSHPNTTFHSEPTDEGEVQPFTITGLKGRHITSTIFHAGRAPATVLVTAPQTTVISQATPDHVIHNNVKFANINQIINSSPTATHRNLNLASVLVKDERLTKFDSILTDSRELHLSNTASAIVHSTGTATQVIRRVCYDDDKRDTRYLMDEPEPLIAGDDAKMIAEDSSRDATLESIAGDDDNSLPERHAELFWESNSASERSDGRRPLDFSSDSEKCCKSPSFDETNSTDSSGVGTHVRLDSVIKDTRGLERSTSGDGSSADDIHPPLRTYPAKRMYHAIDGEMERSMSGKTRAGFPEERSESLEVRRRASGRGVVKRGCHCCNGSPAPPRPKKPRQRKPTMDFTSN
nr:uncharacterized protein LOC113393698 isoform X4 [Vanessa tameamea]